MDTENFEVANYGDYLELYDTIAAAALIYFKQTLKNHRVLLHNPTALRVVIEKNKGVEN